jgi:flavodoxin
MKILVLYDSVFGCTEKIALAIAGALKSAGEIEVIKMNGAAPPVLGDFDLLIAGSPTRQFRATEGMMNFLKAIPPGRLKGKKYAVFDTRLDVKDIRSPIARFIVDHGGYAVRQLAAVLEKGEAMAPGKPAWFYVEKSEGPLKAGELERAAQWAAAIPAGIKP